MNVGDYVMGKDRKYRRSLYRVHRFVNNELFDLEFIILGGTVGGGTAFDISANREISEFAVATAFDIKMAFSFKQLTALKRLLEKLDVKEFFQVPL